MTNPHYTDIRQYRDVESTNMYEIMVNRRGITHQDMMAILAQKSRDNSRRCSGVARRMLGLLGNTLVRLGSKLY